MEKVILKHKDKKKLKELVRKNREGQTVRQKKNRNIVPWKPQKEEMQEKGEGP